VRAFVCLHTTGVCERRSLTCPSAAATPGCRVQGARHAGGRRSGARPDGERLDDVAVLVKVDLQQQDVRVVVAQLTQLPPPDPASVPHQARSRQQAGAEHDTTRRNSPGRASHLGKERPARVAPLCIKVDDHQPVARLRLCASHAQVAHVPHNAQQPGSSDTGAQAVERERPSIRRVAALGFQGGAAPHQLVHKILHAVDVCHVLRVVAGPPGLRDRDLAGRHRERPVRPGRKLRHLLQAAQRHRGARQQGQPSIPERAHRAARPHDDAGRRGECARAHLRR